MKLHTFQVGDQRRVGVEVDTQLVDLTSAYNALLSSQGAKPGALRALPADMLSFIRLGNLALEAARETLAFIRKRPALPVGEHILYPIEAVQILAPIPRPGKIICAEMVPGGSENIVVKLPNTVVGPGERIVIPSQIKHTTCRAALALVIGKRTKSASVEQIQAASFGLTILSDISANAENPALGHCDFLSKNFDSFCPLGPCIRVTAESSESRPRSIRLSLNEKLIEEIPAAPLMERLPILAAHLSSIMTLEPGDIISLSATPAGQPAISLKPGDSILTESDFIGQLQNSVLAG